MSYFDKAIEFVLEHEGGYSWNKFDPGGETRYGICKRNYPRLDIKGLTKEQAIDIYRMDYWRDYMEEMPERVAYKHFDQVVNMGHKQANKLLQRAVDCEDDGIIGKLTLEAVNKQEEAVTLCRLADEQLAFYKGLIEKKPTLATFKNGWNKRASWIPNAVA